MITKAKINGYVETFFGRRIPIRGINSKNFQERSFAERQSINAPIQGSAADIIKIAMIKIHKRLEEGNWNSKMLLQVHDELVFDVPKTEVKSLSALIKEEMEHAFKLDVPLTVDIGVGDNWLQAH
jgi:DNA polymerase-1